MSSSMLCQNVIMFGGPIVILKQAGVYLALLGPTLVGSKLELAVRASSAREPDSRPRSDEQNSEEEEL